MSSDRGWLDMRIVGSDDRCIALADGDAAVGRVIYPGPVKPLALTYALDRWVHGASAEVFSEFEFQEEPNA